MSLAPYQGRCPTCGTNHSQEFTLEKWVPSTTSGGAVANPSELESLRQQLAECQARESERIKALQEVTKLASSYICAHDETYRGGAIWEICSLCGAKWADDEGGKPTFKWQKAIIYANEALALPNDATALNELIAERTASLTAEVEWGKSAYQELSARVEAGFDRCFEVIGNDVDRKWSSIVLFLRKIPELTAELQSTRLQMITDFGQYQEAHEKVNELTAQRTAFKDAAEYNKRRAEDAERQRDQLLSISEEIKEWLELGDHESQMHSRLCAAIANCK